MRLRSGTLPGWTNERTGKRRWPILSSADLLLRHVDLPSLADGGGPRVLDPVLLVEGRSMSAVA
jgi:hypothetical protein